MTALEASDIVDLINWNTDVDASLTTDLWTEVTGAWVRLVSENRRYIAGDITRKTSTFEIQLNDADLSTIDTVMDALQDLEFDDITEDFEDALGDAWTKENSDRDDTESYGGSWGYLLTGVSNIDSDLIYTLPVADAIHSVSFYAKWKTYVKIARFFVQSLAGAGWYIDADANIGWWDGESLVDLGEDMTEDTWYKFEINNVNINTQTFDLVLDGDTLVSDADWSPAGLSTITTFKWNVDNHSPGNQYMWIDNITISYEQDRFLKPIVSFDLLGQSRRTGNYTWRVMLEYTNIS